MKFKSLLVLAAVCGAVSTTLTTLLCTGVIRADSSRQDWMAVNGQVRDIAMCAVLVWAVRTILWAVREFRVKPATAYKLGDEDGYRRAMRDKADAPIPFIGRTRRPAGRR